MDESKKCMHCGKEVPSYLNYCSWDCHVDAARKEGGPVIAPNGLPIRCLRYDGAMMEHEHADHPTYMFPVEVTYCGEKPVEDEHGEYSDRTHALIYTDGAVALTMYEHSYELWSLSDGSLVWSLLILPSYKKTKLWKLTDASLAEIRALNP